MLQNLLDPDTYAGTNHIETQRLGFSVSVFFDLDLSFHDIKICILNPSLKENLYHPMGVSDDVMHPMVFPKGICQPH
jgi:hypothetical protein